MSGDLERARLKKLAKEEKELKNVEKAKLEAKPLENIFAWSLLFYLYHRLTVL